MIHHLLSTFPLFYALGVVMLLTNCCPRADATNYGWPLCACPQAQLIWKQSVKSATLCGYPAYSSPADPPVFYSTISISGTLTYGGTDNYVYSGSLTYPSTYDTGSGCVESGTMQVVGPGDSNAGLGYGIVDAPGAGLSINLIFGTWTLSGTTATYAPTATGWTGSVTITLSGPIDEDAVLTGLTAVDSWYEGGFIGGAIDWYGPVWADHIGPAIMRADGKFAVLVTNLVAGLPMKVTVQVYQATFMMELFGNIMGTPTPYGSPIVLTFTPTDTWALVGCTTPGGFDPTSFDPTTLTPTETLISGAVPEGMIYGAVIVAVEPA